MNRTEFMSKVRGQAGGGFGVERVELAYLLAKKFHQGQWRMAEMGPNGTLLRYFEHPRRVALILLDEVGVTDASTVATALLHDVIEDAAETDLVTRLIDNSIGTRVGSSVRALTKRPKQGYQERLRASFDGSFGDTLLVKAADRLDNLRTLPKDDPGFCARQKEETRQIYLPLFMLYPRYVPEACFPGIKRVIDEIRALSEGV